MAEVECYADLDPTEGAFFDGIGVQAYEGRGKGVVALRDVEPDTVVATGRPITWCLEPKWGRVLCESCLEPKTVPGCATCGTGGRCDNCPPEHVPEHDNTECKAFRAMATIIEQKSAENDDFNPHDMTLIVRSLYRLRRTVGAEEKGHPVWSLSRQISTNPEKTAFRKCATKIASKMTRTDKDEMWRLCHIIETNSYSVYRHEWYRPSACSARVSDVIAGKPAPEQDKPIGIAVYLGLSYFNHSCAPNVTKVRRGLTVDIVSARAIASGEEVCHSYVPPDMSQGKRKDELEHNWGFLCGCARCADASDMWAINAVCACGGYLIQAPDEDSSICCKCGEWTD